MAHNVVRGVAPHLGCLLFLLIPIACQPPGGGGQDSSSPDSTERILARAKALELDTEYVPPPGDTLEHHTSGFAKILCSAVFITGLDPEFAVKNVGYFTSPFDERDKVVERRIDREARFRRDRCRARDQSRSRRRPPPPAGPPVPGPGSPRRGARHSARAVMRTPPACRGFRPATPRVPHAVAPPPGRCVWPVE